MRRPKQNLFETEFEATCFDLRLAEADWEKSIALRRWVERNVRRRYVPETLLLAWGIRVPE